MNVRNQILQEKEKRLNGFWNNFHTLIKDYRSEISIIEDYRGRQLLELLQNCDDAFIDENDKVEVEICFKNDEIVISNTGKPFSIEGIVEALMYDRHSTKINEFGKTGEKGIGLRSILSWCDFITIETQKFVCEYSTHYATESLENDFLWEKFNKVDEYRLRNEKILSYPIFTCPKVSDGVNTNKWATRIRIKIKNDDFVKEDIINQLSKDFSCADMVFMRHIFYLKIIINNEITTYIKNKISHNQIEICRNDFTFKWHLFSYDNKYILAFSKEFNELFKKTKFIYKVFRTQITLDSPFLINMDLKLNSDRNDWQDNEYNRKLFNDLPDKIFDLINKIPLSNDWERANIILKLLTNLRIEKIDNKTSFYKNIHSLWKNIQCFPTISGKFLSYNQNPKFSKLKFCKYLVPAYFHDLLKEDELNIIESFANKLNYRFNFYDVNEFTNIFNNFLNNNIDNYDLNKRANLIYLYDQQYCPESNFGPNFLVDIDNFIIKYGSKSFVKGSSENILMPEWANIKFVNNNLANLIKEKFGERIYVIEWLGIKEYTFNYVFSYLNSLASIDQSKNFDVIKFIYKKWQISKTNTPKLDTSIYLYSAENEKMKDTDLYLDEVFGNTNENTEILKHLNSFFLNSSYLKLIDEHDNVNDLFRFLTTYLKINYLPKFDYITFNNLNDVKEYLEYCLRFKKDIYIEQHGGYAKYDSKEWNIVLDDSKVFTLVNLNNIFINTSSIMIFLNWLKNLDLGLRKYFYLDLYERNNESQLSVIKHRQWSNRKISANNLVFYPNFVINKYKNELLNVANTMSAEIQDLLKKMIGIQNSDQSFSTNLKNLIYETAKLFEVNNDLLPELIKYINEKFPHEHEIYVIQNEIKRWWSSHNLEKSSVNITNESSEINLIGNETIEEDNSYTKNNNSILHTQKQGINERKALPVRNNNVAKRKQGDLAEDVIFDKIENFYPEYLEKKKVPGNDLGYDIEVTLKNNKRKFIEVKSTKINSLGRHANFLMTRKEFDFMNNNKSDYVVIWIHNMLPNQRWYYRKIDDWNKVTCSAIQWRIEY